MSHPEQRKFCAEVQQGHSKHFVDRRVLDVGSLDVNGTNRSLFSGGKYTGCDIVPGKNVDHVGPIWTVPGTFQTIISTEMLEHDAHWQQSLKTMVEKLERGGLLVLTCAGPGRAVHGFGPKKHGWETMHYKNLAPGEILAELGEQNFTEYSVSYSSTSHDTYFVGVRA